MSDFYNLKVNINKAQSTRRLDKALTNILGRFSRSHIKILIENGNVKKNNKIINEPSHLVKEGEIFEVSLIYNRPKKHDPEELKLAVIIAVFKNKGDPRLFPNYRPMSLLSNINKIFEKLVHTRLYSFLELHDCIYELQFGFRTKH